MEATKLICLVVALLAIASISVYYLELNGLRNVSLNPTVLLAPFYKDEHRVLPGPSVSYTDIHTVNITTYHTAYTLKPSHIGIITVSDRLFRQRYKWQSQTMQCYANRHGYDYFEIDMDLESPECAVHGDVFFRKHCAVRSFLKRLPEGYALFVMDGDVVGNLSDTPLTRWLTSVEGENIFPDVIFYERAWNFELAAGNYMVRNTEFGRRFLYLWASFEFQRPMFGFSSSDNGAIHLALLHVIGFRNMQQCYNLYHALASGINDLAPYYKFVACTRKLLGPSRSWIVKGDVSGNIVILDRYMAWVMDGYMVNFAFGAFHPFHHGIKHNEPPPEYHFTGPDTCTFSFAGSDRRLQSEVEMGVRLRDAENFFASDQSVEQQPWGQIPRWPILDCLVTWTCKPLADDDIREVRSFPLVYNKGTEVFSMTKPNRVGLRSRALLAVPAKQDEDCAMKKV